MSRYVHRPQVAAGKSKGSDSYQQDTHWAHQDARQKELERTPPEISHNSLGNHHTHIFSDILNSALGHAGESHPLSPTSSSNSVQITRVRSKKIERSSPEVLPCLEPKEVDRTSKRAQAIHNRARSILMLKTGFRRVNTLGCEKGDQKHQQRPQRTPAPEHSEQQKRSGSVTSSRRISEGQHIDGHFPSTRREQEKLGMGKKRKCSDVDKEEALLDYERGISPSGRSLPPPPERSHHRRKLHHQSGSSASTHRRDVVPPPEDPTHSSISPFFAQQHNKANAPSLTKHQREHPPDRDSRAKSDLRSPAKEKHKVPTGSHANEDSADELQQDVEVLLVDKIRPRGKGVISHKKNILRTYASPKTKIAATSSLSRPQVEPPLSSPLSSGVFRSKRPGELVVHISYATRNIFQHDSSDDGVWSLEITAKKDRIAIYDASILEVKEVGIDIAHIKKIHWAEHPPRLILSFSAGKDGETRMYVEFVEASVARRIAHQLHDSHSDIKSINATECVMHTSSAFVAAADMV